MNASYSTLAALAAVLFLALPSALARPADDVPSTPSAGAAQVEPKKKRSAPAGVPFRGTVGSVDSIAQTVTLAGKKKDRVLHVTGQTRLERDGKPVAIGEIKPGDYARGSISKDAEGHEVVLKATFGEPPAESARTDASAPETARNGR